MTDKLRTLGNMPIPLKNVIALVITLLGAAFATGMFYSESMNHEKELQDLRDRQDKKIEIQKEHLKLTNQLENKIIVLETKIDIYKYIDNLLTKKR